MFRSASLMVFCLLGACSEEPLVSPQSRPEKKVMVGMLLSEGNTKTSINEDANGFRWDLGDKIAVWAENADHNYVLENHTFSLYMRDVQEGRSFFTSTLSAPMAQGTYSYYLAYPLPVSVSGTLARFVVPSVQDGKVSGGTDITLSGETVYSELKEALPDNQGIVPVPASLHHLLHFLRFYIPEGANIHGEPITEIVIRMPQAIAGNLDVDVTDLSSATLSSGVNELTLKLSEPLNESGSVRQYAVAGIFPPASEYGAADFMEVELFSENFKSTIDGISLVGRTFEAGHVTGVRLSPASVSAVLGLDFVLESNDLGQDPIRVTLTLPEGTVWPETGSNAYSYDCEDGELGVGESFKFKTLDEDAYRNLSGKTVNVLFESEDAFVSQTVVIPDLSTGTSQTVELNVPYLFFEDFSAISADFHYNDEHSNSNTGDLDGHIFLEGWSGARIGGQSGTSIRIAAHREISRNYPARCDSPFISGLKQTSDAFTAEGKNITLQVKYNYSMGRQEGGIGSANAGMEMYFGYSTQEGTISSGSSHGSFGESTTITETDGSFTNIYHEAEEIISGMGKEKRLSWKNDCTSSYGLNNSTCWMYIDNIRVSIIGNKD